jgi:hypothetical protein
MGVILFRIPAPVSEASHAESSILFFLFVKVDPMNAPFSPFLRERGVDNDGIHPVNKSRVPAESGNVSDGA